MEKRGNKILVTGGAGYIGSVLSEKILANDYHLIIFDNFSITDDGIQNVEFNPNIKIINGDIRDIEKWKSSVEGVDTIIHLAGVSDARSGKQNPNLTKEINKTAFPALVEESKRAGISRFILASTFGVYGNQYKLPLTEDLDINPIDPYSESKAYGEIIMKESNTDNFTTACLRIAMVYGVSQRMRFDFIINNLVIKALIDKKLTVWGGEQRRPQIHIQDITDYLMKFIEFDKKVISGKVLNAGAYNPTIREIAETVKDSIGNIRIEYLSKRENEDSFVLDSNKIKNVLQLQPYKSISFGIEELIESYNSGMWKNINDKKYYN